MLLQQNKQLQPKRFRRITAHDLCTMVTTVSASSLPKPMAVAVLSVGDRIGGRRGERVTQAVAPATAAAVAVPRTCSSWCSSVSTSSPCRARKCSGARRHAMQSCSQASGANGAGRGATDAARWLGPGLPAVPWAIVV